MIGRLLYGNRSFVFFVDRGVIFLGKEKAFACGGGYKKVESAMGILFAIDHVHKITSFHVCGLLTVYKQSGSGQI